MALYAFCSSLIFYIIIESKDDFGETGMTDSIIFNNVCYPAPAIHGVRRSRSRIGEFLIRTLPLLALAATSACAPRLNQSSAAAMGPFYSGADVNRKDNIEYVKVVLNCLEKDTRCIRVDFNKNRGEKAREAWQYGGGYLVFAYENTGSDGVHHFYETERSNYPKEFGKKCTASVWPNSSVIRFECGASKEAPSVTHYAVLDLELANMGTFASKLAAIPAPPPGAPGPGERRPQPVNTAEHNFKVRAKIAADVNGATKEGIDSVLIGTASGTQRRLKFTFNIAYTPGPGEPVYNTLSQDMFFEINLKYFMKQSGGVSMVNIASSQGEQKIFTIPYGEKVVFHKNRKGDGYDPVTIVYETQPVEVSAQATMLLVGNLTKKLTGYDFVTRPNGPAAGQ